ncbi:MULTISPECIES: right-handed parallel beta-helix repeat-containing protein [Bacillaceae]|nr:MULTISPECIES: right-handed parallel beta-helix repeat-containing protein [Bacillaceae]KQL55834.1 hypothetical protein AN965_16220 [Alkalicoccobacillus plakortidis]
MKKIQVSRKLLSKYKTIRQALLDANDGDTIEIEPGLYNESLQLSKSVTIIGLSNQPEDVRIAGRFKVTKNASVHIKNLSFSQSDKGLLIEQGHAYVIHCQFHELKKYAIQIKEQGHLSLTDATIRHNGIGIHNRGRARIEYCALYEQHGSQVYTGSNGRLIMKHSHLYNGETTAFYFDQESRSYVEHCQLYGHHSSQRQIKAQGNSEAVLESCQIYESQSGAVYLQDHAKLTFRSSRFSDNVPVQIEAHGGELFLKNSTIENGQIGIKLENGSKGEIEQCTIKDHTHDQLMVQDASAYLFHCKVHNGERSAISQTANSYVYIEATDLFNHAMPQLALSEKARLSMKHSSVFEGAHYGLWLTERSSATIAHCRFFDNELNQLVVADFSEATLDDVDVFNGRQSGLYIIDGSLVHLTNSSFYHHHDAYPQLFVSNGSQLNMNESKVIDSYESGIRFEKQSYGLIEHCQINGHYEAQIDIRNSSPTIRETFIQDGGTCAIRLLHAGGFIENCFFTGHEHNIAIGGSCETDIIGQEADALRQYEEALSQTIDMDAGLKGEELHNALKKAQETADRDARTAEIVGLVEQLEERLGKK